MSSCFDPWLTGACSLDVMLAGFSDSAFRQRQALRLSALLEAAASGSRFYRDRLRGVRSLQEIAPVGKRELMARFGAWVADPRLSLARLRPFLADPARVGEAYAGEFILWQSSGSRGSPGVFVQDARAMAVYDSLEACRRAPRWRDPWYMAERIVFVGATDGHFASTVTVERLRRLNPVMAINLHAVSFLQPTPELVAKLNSLAPGVISTYPTVAVLLAAEAAEGRLRIAPREIWTGGETLTPAMRRVIERSFGCGVINSYGASEFLSLASQCSFGSLHLNSDWAILEPVDEQGGPVPQGALSHTTLLTNLANHVQPVIRYDLGDKLLVHRNPCACGSPLPAIEVLGRSDDLLVLRARDGSRVRLPPLALTTVLEEEGGVFDFQLVRVGDGALRLNVRADAARSARAVEALRSYLCAQGLPQVRVHAVRGGTRVRGRTGKLRRVVAS